jgi:hypothetical protein
MRRRHLGDPAAGENQHISSGTRSLGPRDGQANFTNEGGRRNHPLSQNIAELWLQQSRKE